MDGTVFLGVRGDTSSGAPLLDTTGRVSVVVEWWVYSLRRTSTGKSRSSHKSTDVGIGRRSDIEVPLGFGLSGSVR